MTTLNMDTEVHQASFSPPGGAFTPSSSADVFFESDIGGSACLFPSKHKAHAWFLSEAESCKERFLASMQVGRYFECSDVVTALSYKLIEQGSIYERKLGNQNLLQGQQWQPVSGFYEVRDLVFRALLTHYKANNTNAAATTDETLDIVAVLAAMPHQKPKDYSKGEKANAPLVGGPHWLLQAAAPNSAAPCRSKVESEKTHLMMHCKPHMVDTSQHDKKTASRPPKSRDSSGKVATSSPLKNSLLQAAQQTLSPPDVCIDEAKTNDVICAGDRREDGVPQIEHIGNVLFHQRISIMAAEFAKASIVEKGKHALKCVDMVRQLSGRFLLKCSEADNAVKKPQFTELSLEDARWRVYWALEKSQLSSPSTKKKAKKSKTSAKNGETSVRRSADAAAAKKKPETGRDGDGKTPDADSQTSRRESPPSIELEHIPTHLTFLSKADTPATTAYHPSAAKSKGQPVKRTSVSVSSSDSKEGSNTSMINKADRARRRQEKLQRARDILAGRSSADPLADMAQLRRASIEELKTRQKRTQIRKRLATWDPDE